MMNLIELKFEHHCIPFKWGNGCQDAIVRELINLDADRFVLISDATVELLHAKNLADSLGSSAPILLLSADPGESTKTLAVLTDYCERAIEWGATRRTVVVTVGGGVPGNLGGMLAALLFRGIRLVHVPTSVIAALDSVVSLKQAVNSRFGKNLFGVYYAPIAVLADTQMFHSLPPRERRSGIIELIKNALAVRPDTIGLLRKWLNHDAEYDSDAWAALLPTAIDSKLRLMRTDQLEKKQAIVFEYGHTIGHAIELNGAHLGGVSSISHGDAVGLGMLVAASISARITNLPKRAIDIHWELLEQAGAPLTIPAEIKTADIQRVVGFDNKRGYYPIAADIVPMILLEDLGRPAGRSDCPLTDVAWPMIEDTIREFRIERG